VVELPLLPPPPDPPVKPLLSGDGAPPPPPADVIVEKIEFEPGLPGAGFVVQTSVLAPPPPTVIGYPCAVTGKAPQDFAKGDIVGAGTQAAADNLNPPAPPPPKPSLVELYAPPDPPPANTKYSAVFEPCALPAQETQKVAGPVKICVLKLPEVFIVPPVAVTYCAVGAVS
jgi:hypothetical protein